MITNLKNSKRIVKTDLLDHKDLLFDYTLKFLSEIGCDLNDVDQPFGEDPWFIEGDLHGLSVSANYTEDLYFHISDKKVLYNNSIKDTFNEFINVYRDTWNEQVKPLQDPS